MVKCQIEGSNVDKILRYLQKANEKRNTMKIKSNDLDLRSGRNSDGELFQKHEHKGSK